MFRGLKGCLKEANKTSLLIVKYGLMLSCLVLAFGVMQLANSPVLDLNKSLNSFEIIKIGLIIFTESFVFGTSVDLYSKRIKKNKG